MQLPKEDSTLNMFMRCLGVSARWASPVGNCFDICRQWTRIIISFCVYALYCLWVIMATRVCKRLCTKPLWSQAQMEAWGSLLSSNLWQGEWFPLSTASVASPEMLLGFGLGQCTVCRLSIGFVMVSLLLWEIVTYLFLAVTIPGVKSLSSNFQSSDTL